MPEPNVRDLVADIREALERHPREALIEILTYVFKEYVVEGPAPLAALAPSTTVLKDDLAGQSFAEIIRSLQLRLDLPELALFEVQGERVFIKQGGRNVPIEAQASRPEPMPTPTPMASPTPPAPPAGLTTMSVATPQRSTPGSSREDLPLVPSSAARPTAPSTTAPRAPTAPAAKAQSPATGTAGAATGKAQPGAPAKGDEKPAAGDTTGRFNLLEID